MLLKNKKTPVEQLRDEIEQLLDDKKFGTAAEKAAELIKLDPRNYKNYLLQSLAEHRSSHHEAALIAAEKAIVAARASTINDKDEAIGTAQLRRAISLLSLGRYADAAFAMELAERAGTKDKTKDIWKSKIDGKLQENKTVGIQEVPDQRIEGVTPELGTGPRPVVSMHAQDPKSTRIEFVQSGDTIDVSLMVKGAPKEKTSVKFSQQAVNVKFPRDEGTDYVLDLNPLWAPIDVKESSFRVFGTKIELYLTKQEPGRWAAVLNDGTMGVTAAAAATTSPNKMTSAPAEAVSKNSAPVPEAAPSGKHLPFFQKNWEKMAKEALGDDEEDRADPDAFFKSLYENADDDAKRAMLKSYTESNGTALSTNWDDVSKRKVETTPPDGSEVKKW